MSQSQPRELVLSRKVLRVLLVLNPLFGVFILILLAASFIAEGTAIRVLTEEHGAGGRTFLLGARWIMVLGILSLMLVQVALKRLLAIVETVSAGDPFVLLNAERLKTIAWSILGLEVLHLGVGIIARGMSRIHPLDIEWQFSLTRWLVVLLLFVLARVFEQGARMRDELEGTV